MELDAELKFKLDEEGKRKTTYSIICSTLARITKHIPSFIDHLKLLICSTFIRVRNESGLMESFFDLFLICFTSDTQRRVVISI